jgi:drug/metabolite transporter (DMT)-like permease
MTATVILALATSALFGVGDFLGGFATRRDSAMTVTATSHMVSIVLLAAAALLMPATAVGGRDIAFGALAGLSGVFGVMSLFAALALGRMSVVAPVVAALSAAIPATYDMITGTRLSAVTLAGIALALVAIVIVSIAPDQQPHGGSHEYRPRRALALALVAGVGFSGAFIALSFTGAESGFAPVVASRVVSIAVAVPLALRFGRGFPVDRSARPATLGAGVTDAFANITMLSAIRLGPLAVASVLGSFFPVVVVILARVFLKERLHSWQRVGVVIALVAVVLAAVP